MCQGAEWLSLPQLFKESGYLTLGHGKLYHPNLPPDNDPPSWSPEVPYTLTADSFCTDDTVWNGFYCPDDAPPPQAFSDHNVTYAALKNLQTALEEYETTGSVQTCCQSRSEVTAVGPAPAYGAC